MNDWVVVEEDADDAGAAFDLLVQSLQRVGALDVAPMLWREGPESEDVLPGLLHQRGSCWEFLREHRDHLIPLLLHGLGLGLHEH